MTARRETAGLALPVLLGASLCHLLNDVMQSVFVATYPLIKSEFALSFAQVGVLTLTFQITASLLQPLIGQITDRYALPYTLPFASLSSMIGIFTVANAPSYPVLLAGAAMLGIGSSIFHPEASRISRRAAGASHGLAQSIFQVGGNFGSSLGPLIVLLVVLPFGLGNLAWVCLAAVLAFFVQSAIARWYALQTRAAGRQTAAPRTDLTRRQIGLALGVLAVLMLSKTFYLASFDSFYQFYLIEKFALTMAQAQMAMFAFLGSVAAGTLIGGPIGDRIGRKKVLWGSILGALPFTAALPHVGLSATIALSLIIGFIIASAFSAIVVFAQSLVPHRIGMISGVFFGLLFGFGGLGAASLGLLADATSVTYVYQACAFLPLIGVFTYFLPDTRPSPTQGQAAAKARP